MDHCIYKRRHKLNLQKEYFKGKYERFTYKQPKVGFKNSQIPDTGIITKYASAYLKSYFGRVEAVKGGMVAEFRKAKSERLLQHHQCQQIMKMSRVADSGAALGLS